jgi:hypothetical protein
MTTHNALLPTTVLGRTPIVPVATFGTPSGFGTAGSGGGACGRKCIGRTTIGRVDRQYDEAAAAKRGDHAHAIKLWRQLAASGDGMSQYHLGQSYEFAHGVAVNLVEAAVWYRRAAERGIADARLNLGIAYAVGRGVPTNLPEAYLWLDLAAATYAKDEDRNRTIKARELVAAKMTDAEITDAQRLARERALSGEPIDARH